jgi:hypothetical protein
MQLIDDLFVLQTGLAGAYIWDTVRQFVGRFFLKRLSPRLSDDMSATECKSQSAKDAQGSVSRGEHDRILLSGGSAVRTNTKRSRQATCPALQQKPMRKQYAI